MAQARLTLKLLLAKIEAMELEHREWQRAVEAVGAACEVMQELTERMAAQASGATKLLIKTANQSSSTAANHAKLQAHVTKTITSLNEILPGMQSDIRELRLRYQPTWLDRVSTN